MTTTYYVSVSVPSKSEFFIDAGSEAEACEIAAKARQENMTVSGATVGVCRVEGGYTEIIIKSKNVEGRWISAR